VASELLFRVIFTVLWFSFIGNLSWVRYSARMSSGERPADEAGQREGRLHMVGLALFAPVWFGGIALYIVLPGWIAPLSIPVPDWLRMPMGVVAAASLSFALWGYVTIGRNWVHAFEPSRFLLRDETLVTSGPYRYVRNPIYLGMFSFVIAVSLLAANWLILLPIIPIIAVVYGQVGKEEEMLIQRFGDEYRAYMKLTPRFIPRFRGKRATQPRKQR
jgi:protein-S-isoprenylcysteine O-methyltransferase Ste14